MKDLGLFLLHVVAGTTLAAHGYPKLFGGPGKQPHPVLARTMGTNYPAAVERGRPGFIAGLQRMGIPYPELAARASGLTEFGGGLALAAGIMTRPIALAITVNMAVATWSHRKVGFYGQGGFEFPLLLGTAALGLTLTGPGAISIDGLLLNDD